MNSKPELCLRAPPLGQQDAKTYVSAEQPSPREDARVPDANENEGRPRGSGAPQGERPLEADSERRAPGSVREVIRPPLNDSSFPKSARILKSSAFRTVYDEGTRISGPYFSAFCLRVPEGGGPRVGFTAPRALGKAVVRNRIKRRVREAVRKELHRLGPQWHIVINPRRTALDAALEDITREVQRVFDRCKE